MKEIQEIGNLDLTKRNDQDYFKKSKYVKELTPQHFDPIKTYLLRRRSQGEYKLLSKEDVFIIFYAPWCGHCKKAKPIMEQLGNIMTFADVAAFNCEKYKSHVDKMNMDYKGFIKQYPTLIFYKKGEPYKRFEGERDLGALLKFCMKCK